MKNMYILTVMSCIALNAQTTLEPQYVNPTTIRSGFPPTDGPTVFVEGEPYVSGMSSGYSLPVRIPKAAANFAPELSINYNSSFGNGIMGMNWSISGLSQISRSHKILGFDGEIKKHKQQALLLLIKRHHFFALTSFKTSIDNSWSATIFFRLAFSDSRSFMR
ncbi:MAG: hypothetical protein LAT54_08930 [Cryomorphaceae bacterium]|nr:hypothetical protein [Cryomorphaceae bacterium]